MTRARPAAVRLYHSVRSAHLERARELAPAAILYSERRFDFDAALLSGLDVRRAGTLRAIALLARWRPGIVEVTEPLMRPGLRRMAACVAALRVVSPRSRLVAYAIENRDPFPRTRGARARASRALDRRASRFVHSRLDRLAFGTDSARELYERLLGSGPTARTVPALPAACSCPPADRNRGSVLFLGALLPRKGVPELVAAWSAVAARHPLATLVIAGSGRLEPDVRAAVAATPSMSLVVGAPRDEVHRLLRTATVVVLPSQPSPAWREQVGLPIVEALAHGCEVVTTDQTGLAGWLAGHGHRVVPAPTSAGVLAAAIVDALGSPRPAEIITAPLPHRDGRLAADDWLREEEAV